MQDTELRLLLIDDDEDDFVNIRELLSEIPGRRFRLEWQPNFESGLETLLSQPFAACLLDYRLGQWTGLDLMREARQRGSNCPMILLTGHGDFDLDVKAMESGAADYLVKGQITAPLLERAIRYSVKHAADMQELSEQKENFQTLFNSTFEGILVLRQGVIIDANAAAQEIFGAGTGDLLNRPLVDFIRPETREELSRQLGTGRDIQLEAVGLKSDGSEMFIALSSRTINLKGHWVSLIAIRDLTHRKQMEAQILQQDRLASLGLLASSLAHEIGTPLGVIRGRAEMLTKFHDEKIKSTMDLIIGQIDRISKLVNSLLHIARGQSSEATVDVNLHTVIQDVTNLMNPHFRGKNIDLEVDVPTDMMVRAEAGPLGQVFLNLLVNAVHAIESGPKRERGFIRLHAKAINNHVEIQVIDSGCGISEKNLARLFQPFFTTKDIGVGTGLGLATSFKLVQSWGGSIRATSKPNEGATFIITLRARA